MVVSEYTLKRTFEMVQRLREHDRHPEWRETNWEKGTAFQYYSGENVSIYPALQNGFTDDLQSSRHNTIMSGTEGNAKDAVGPNGRHSSHK